MKILHITASYKPAFIYGGPIYSVAALCEELNAESLKLKAESWKAEVRGPKSEVRSSMSEVLSPKSEFGSLQSDINITVYTTLANGKTELPYQNGAEKIVEGVSVKYFKRITKDHSHFSPTLLIQLWRNAKKFDIIHIHAWWNLVSMGAVIICLMKGIKPIVSPRGMLGDYTFSTAKKLFHQLIGKFLLRKCYFHATTPMEAKEIAKRVFDGKAAVVDLMELEVESGKIEVESGKSGVRSPQIEVESDKGIESFDSEVSNILLDVGSGEREVESGKLKVESGKSVVRSPQIEVESDKGMGKQIFIIHNMVKVPENLPVKTRVFDGSLKLIFLSRIHHKKGIELLLDALAMLTFPFTLTIVGEGELDYVKSLKWKVESLKLTGQIDWIGAVYGDQKFQLLADHDALILPSWHENFANVVIESIAVQTPVILSDQVGLSDFIKKNNFGLVCELNSLRISEALNNYYELLKQESGIKITNFNPDHIKELYLNLYERIY